MSDVFSSYPPHLAQLFRCILSQHNLVLSCHTTNSVSTLRTGLVFRGSVWDMVWDKSNLGPFQLLLDTHYQKFMFWDQAISAPDLSQIRSRKFAGTKSTSKKKFIPKKITFKFVPANLRERNPPQKNHLQFRSRKFAGTKSTSEKILFQKKSPSNSFPQICGNEIYLQKNSIPKKITFKFVPAILRERNPTPKKFHPKKITFKSVPANLRERNSPPKKSPLNPFPQICGNEIHLKKNSNPKNSLSNPFPQNCGNENQLQ
ncbi:hypothetical protein DFH07DRAFT_784788 [Mycena maculata]|uniref:Uncharacterized protein n=1 Tax=Mycena maculata TaxID=230809 RepID=A0AAD7HEF2_9AGAR|nr:hypothetical protein DFH07DRAFT_784788 [Mycena maculata]